jgi:hypothetical protein
VETATQALHRLTSYEPGREWTEAISDPRVVRDLEVNDLARLPWFFKRYTQSLPRTALPRSLPATTAPDVPHAVTRTANETTMSNRIAPRTQKEFERTRPAIMRSSPTRACFFLPGPAEPDDAR